MCHCCRVTTCEVCESNRSSPHGSESHHCFLKMEKLHLLHLFDGQDSSLGTNTRRLRLFLTQKLFLPPLCEGRSSRSLNNLHGVTRQTLELHGIMRETGSFQINQQHEGVTEASEQTLSQAPSKQLKNTLMRHTDCHSRVQRRYLPHGHLRPISDEDLKGSGTKEKK